MGIFSIRKEFKVQIRSEVSEIENFKKDAQFIILIWINDFHEPNEINSNRAPGNIVGIENSCINNFNRTRRYQYCWHFESCQSNLFIQRSQTDTRINLQSKRERQIKFTAKHTQFIHNIRLATIHNNLHVLESIEFTLRIQYNGHSKRTYTTYRLIIPNTLEILLHPHNSNLLKSNVFMWLCKCVFENPYWMW